MKILIFGASGSGVTTTGKHLAQKLGIDYFDSDDYFWQKSAIPYSLRCPSESRNSKIKCDLEKSENWILGGSIFQWGENVFPDFDLAVFLWIPSEIRIKRLQKREIEKYGTIIYTDIDRSIKFKKFIEWASDYDKNSGIANRNRQAHEHWMRSLKLPLLRLEGDFTIEDRIKKICEQIFKARSPF